MQSPIKPFDINAKQHFWDAFGNNETEVSAGWIVRYCQQRDNTWAPFTDDDINTYYQERMQAVRPGYRGKFSFNQLIDQGYIIDHGTHYEVTQPFIARCWGASPATPDPAHAQG